MGLKNIQKLFDDFKNTFIGYFIKQTDVNVALNRINNF